MTILVQLQIRVECAFDILSMAMPNQFSIAKIIALVAALIKFQENDDLYILLDWNTDILSTTPNKSGFLLVETEVQMQRKLMEKSHSW